jgi:hypothetical protein
VKAGQLRSLNVSGDLMARCLLALTWMPEDSIRESSGERAPDASSDLAMSRSLTLARDTLLRGALKPA